MSANKKQVGLQGFTLVELVVVIAVLGILAGIAIPRFMAQLEAARKETCLANRSILAKELAVFEAVGGDTEAYFQEQLKNSVASRFHCPSKGVYTLAADHIQVNCSLTEHGGTGSAEETPDTKPEPTPNPGGSGIAQDPGADKNYIYDGTVDYEAHKRYEFGDLVVIDGIIYKCMNADKSASINPGEHKADSYDTWFAVGTTDGSPIDWNSNAYLRYELGTIITYGGKTYMFAPAYNDGRYYNSLKYPNDTSSGWISMDSNPKPVKPAAGIGTNNGYNAVDEAYKHTGASYYKGDKVWYKGQYYVAQDNFSTGGSGASTTPSADSPYWQLAD